MAFNGNFSAGVQRPEPVVLTTTSLTDVFEATDRNATCAEVLIVNEDSSARQVTIEYYDGSTDYAIWTGSVAANSTEIFRTPIRLYSGDKIKAQAAAGNVVTVTPIIAITFPQDQATQ